MIWIIVPAYNEEHSLPHLLPELDATLRRAGVSYRMVAVNDGSSDGTGDILDDLRMALPLDVIHHRFNRGLGETERDGFEFVAARCDGRDVIVRVEADRTHPPEYVLKLVAKIQEGFDVVTTSRFQPGGGQQGVSAYRAFVSRGANLFMQILFGVPGVREYSCGYRAYRASVIQDAVTVFANNFIQLRGLGFTSTLEMVIKLYLLGCRFAEIPFVLRYDRKVSASKMVGSVTTLGYVIMAILYYWPFGGWRSQYHGLRQLYAADRQQAVARYAWRELPRRAVSRIGF
jgi:dolichol-phosphate mannosyltransferase